jgi:hypothetical protein
MGEEEVGIFEEGMTKGLFPGREIFEGTRKRVRGGEGV